jgi:hypothetical protein
VERVSTEVTKLAELVSLQNSLKADASYLITPDHLDEVWHHVNALHELVFPHIVPPFADPFPPSIPSEQLGPLQLTPSTTQPMLPPSQWIENPSYSPESTSPPMEFFSARSDPSSSVPRVLSCSTHIMHVHINGQQITIFIRLSLLLCRLLLPGR